MEGRIDRDLKNSLLEFMTIVSDQSCMSESIAEAKQQFCEIIRRAGAGKETIITKNSRPAAKVVPVVRNSIRLTEEWKARRKGIRLNRPGLKQTTISALLESP
jgi:prevent-host-death family protein